MSTPKDLSPKFTALANSLRGRYAWQYVKTGITSQGAYMTHFELERNGIAIRATPLTGSKGALMGVNFLIAVRTNPIAARTCLRRETALDRFGKRFGINREFHLGDAAFDHAVYIDSDAQDTALARFFDTQGVRLSVLRILGTLPVELHLHPDPLHSVQGTPSIRVKVDLQQFTQTQAVETVLAAATELALECDRMSSAAVGPYGRGGPNATHEDAPLTFRKGRSIVAAALVLVPPFIALVAPNGRSFGGTLILLGLGLGVVLWSCLAVLFARMFRGRSSSLQTVLLLCFFSLGIFPFSVTALEQINVLFDSGPLTTRDAQAHLVRPSKGSPYIVVRATWLSGEPTVHYNETPWACSSSVDVPVKVDTRAGALGVPWIVSLRSP